MEYDTEAAIGRFRAETDRRPLQAGCTHTFKYVGGGDMALGFQMGSDFCSVVAPHQRPSGGPSLSKPLILLVVLFLGVHAAPILPASGGHGIDLVMVGSDDPAGLLITNTYIDHDQHNSPPGHVDNAAIDHFNYRYRFGVCNNGGAYRTDGYDIAVDLFNTPTPSPSGVVWDLTADIVACVQGGGSYTPFDIAHDHWHQACCGSATVDVTEEIAEDVENNNHLNEITAAMHAAQTRVIEFSVFNFDSLPRTFDHSSEGVPSGWSVEFPGGSSTTVSATAEASIEVQIASPATIGSWPDIEIWSKVDGAPGLNQFTTVHVRDDTLFLDSCT